jgi:hypothetical protein
MLALVLAALLRIANPAPHYYTTTDLALAMPYTSEDFRDDLPYTSSDLQSHIPFTVSDWEESMRQEDDCQCLTLKVSPDGSMVAGLTRPCPCQE